MWHDREFWRTAALASAAIGQTLFVLLYLTFPWWKSFMGKALFFKALALGVLADVAILGRVYDWDREDQTFVLLYGVLACGIWFQFFAFLRVRAGHRQNQAVSGNRGSR